jgi:beta-mannosidase
MGINMLRVWGGGLYESDEFYDLCDELGILIWQDFMFACSYYPDTPEWQEKIRHEAEHQVKRLRRHPCIALWCGNNECHQVWQDGWGGKDKQPPRFHGEILYHEVLREVVERLDPGRAYVPGSPFGGEYCNQGGVGDQHYWEVWHGKGDWTHYKDSTARFCSEFGFASSPSPETWRRAGVEANLPPEHEDARWHNKTGKPFEVFRDLVELHYPRAATLEEWSNVTQLNQRDAMRAAIEHFRFSGFCRGTLIWQLNDCWPAESWSLLEFDGRKKAAAEELSRLYAPLLLRLRAEDSRVVLEGCLHNSLEGVSSVAKLEAFDLFSGSKLTSLEGSATLEREGRARLLSCIIPAPGALEWRGEFGGAEVTAVIGSTDAYEGEM